LTKKALFRKLLWKTGEKGVLFAPLSEQLEMLDNIKG